MSDIGKQGGADMAPSTVWNEKQSWLDYLPTPLALGDVWSRRGLDDRTRQIAAVAAFAALGLLPFMQVHAGYALNIGVSEEELKEVVYVTTVTAGFPRAIAASQALSELFAERRAASSTPEVQP